MGARNRVGIGMSYRPARLHSLEWIPGLYKRFKIRAQTTCLPRGLEERDGGGGQHYNAEYKYITTIKIWNTKMTIFYPPSILWALSWTSSKIHSLWMGDIVDSGIGLLYRPASLFSLGGRYDNPMPESTLSPQSGTMNLTTGMKDLTLNHPLLKKLSPATHGPFRRYSDGMSMRAYKDFCICTRDAMKEISR